MGADCCSYCGDIIPEGGQVCRKCTIQWLTADLEEAVEWGEDTTTNVVGNGFAIGCRKSRRGKARSE